MKMRLLFVLTALPGAMAPNANAAYTGLTAELHTTVSVAAQSRSVYRIYANFSNPEDRLVAVFGSPEYGTMTIESRNATNTGLGSPFFNPGATFAPSAAQISANPALQWDTFATIGVSIADQSPFGDGTSAAPGLGSISGQQYVVTNSAWYVLPTIDHDGNAATPEIPPPQSVAGWSGDGDLPNRVLLMQLTVNAGDHVRGTINLAVFPPMGQGGGQIVTYQPFQTFSSFPIPTPPTMALLGLAVMIGAQRRRRERV